jgi:hypothetical protein
VDLRTPAAALTRPTDHARRTLRRAGLLLGAFAIAVAVPVGIAASLSPVDDPVAAGVTAGLATLLICWVLLGLGAARWNRRLAAVDRAHWATEWARVEPSWSGRY